MIHIHSNPEAVDDHVLIAYAEEIRIWQIFVELVRVIVPKSFAGVFDDLRVSFDVSQREAAGGVNAGGTYDQSHAVGNYSWKPLMARWC